MDDDKTKEDSKKGDTINQHSKDTKETKGTKGTKGEQQGIKANREIQDAFFKKIFSIPINALSLVNALLKFEASNNDSPEILTSVDPDSLTERDIKINTLSDLEKATEKDIKYNTLDVLFFEFKINDLSFTVKNKIWFVIEHQSTLFTNFGARFLMYDSDLLKIYYAENDIDILRTKSSIIPAFRNYAFYCGDKMKEAIKKISFNDQFTFKNHDEGLNCFVTIINISKEFNEDLKSDCKALADYVYFLETLQNYRKMGLSPEEALKKTIPEMVEQKILPEFFKGDPLEVYKMLYQDASVNWQIGASFNEGKEEGIEETVIKIAKNMLRNPPVDIDYVSKTTGLEMDEVLKLQAELEV